MRGDPPARQRRDARDVWRKPPRALEAATALAAAGVEVEVIDLRTLRPLDEATLAVSVARTHRMVVVDEGWRWGSLAGEVAARIGEHAFWDLDAPIGRVCSVEVPVPYAKHLEPGDVAQRRGHRRRGEGGDGVTDIAMPSLGADMDKGTLAEWKVKVGDHVARGQIVGLIETQKATMELESFAEGDVDALLVEPGTEVAVGTALARLCAPGEKLAAVAPLAKPAPPPAPLAAAAAVLAAPLAPSGPSPPTPERIRSSPAAGQRAREARHPARRAPRHRPAGAILLRDVQPPPASPAPARRPAPPARGPVRDAIAAAMARSKREIPHYYLAQTIDLGSALGWLGELNAHRSIQDRILPVRCSCARSGSRCGRSPSCNGFEIDGEYRPAEEVHLGNAIALRTGGLIAPAILDAHDKPLDQLMAEPTIW